MMIDIYCRGFLTIDKETSLKTYKTRENSNFLKNGKMVISVKIQNL